MSAGPASPARPARFLEAQHFEGARRLALTTLAAASGLTKGDSLSPERVNAARMAIMAAYATLAPGQTPAIKCKMQTTVEGRVTLTWIIAEPN
jgi:hypothetical protein